MMRLDAVARVGLMFASTLALTSGGASAQQSGAADIVWDSNYCAYDTGNPQTKLGCVVRDGNGQFYFEDAQGVLHSIDADQFQALEQMVQEAHSQQRQEQHHSSISDEELLSHTMGSLTFILFHELAHGLIHELDLPVPGPEENVADEFATIMMIASVQENPRSFDRLLHAAHYWELAWTNIYKNIGGDITKLAFYDEHDLDVRRSINIVCLLYGSNPGQFWPIVKDLLPVDRARECEQEFQRKWDVWSRLLAAHSADSGSSAKQGSIYLEYGSAQSEFSQSLEAMFRKTGELQMLVDDVNQIVALPRDIVVVMSDCNEPNAFWDPGSQRVVFCYELLAETIVLYSNEAEAQ